MALTLAVLLVGAAFSMSATAVPQMVFRGADVQETTALVGENVTITAEVENIGDDGGGFTLTYSQNGSQFTDQRVTVPANTRRQFNQSVSFDEPGTYRISVNGETAGNITVRNAVATVDEETDAQRTLNVQARSVPTDEQTDVALPPSSRSFRLEQWSVQPSGSNYEQALTEYSNFSSAAVVLPPENQSSLVGLLTVDSNVTIENATMQFAVNDSRLDDANISQDEVAVFQHDGDSWEPLDTTIAEQRTQSAVYEATGTDETEYAIGRIDASISVTDTTLQTSPTESGQQLRVEATLSNEGSVDDDYNATLGVNGVEENASTVTVPADGETTVTLSHEVTDAGTYELTSGDTSVGSVVITEGQVSDESGTDGESAGTAEQTDAGGGSPVGDVLPESVPSTIFGFDTLYVGGGVGIVLGLLLGVVLMSRRGGGGSGGDDMGGFEL